MTLTTFKVRLVSPDIATVPTQPLDEGQAAQQVIDVQDPALAGLGAAPTSGVQRSDSAAARQQKRSLRQMERLRTGVRGKLHDGIITDAGGSRPGAPRRPGKDPYIAGEAATVVTAEGDVASVYGENLLTSKAWPTAAIHSLFFKAAASGQDAKALTFECEALAAVLLGLPHEWQAGLKQAHITVQRYFEEASGSTTQDRKTEPKPEPISPETGIQAIVIARALQSVTQGNPKRAKHAMRAMLTNPLEVSEDTQRDVFAVQCILKQTPTGARALDLISTATLAPPSDADIQAAIIKKFLGQANAQARGMRDFGVAAATPGGATDIANAILEAAKAVAQPDEAVAPIAMEFANAVRAQSGPSVLIAGNLLNAVITGASSRAGNPMVAELKQRLNQTANGKRIARLLFAADVDQDLVMITDLTGNDRLAKIVYSSSSQLTALCETDAQRPANLHEALEQAQKILKGSPPRSDIETNRCIAAAGLVGAMRLLDKPDEDLPPELASLYFAAANGLDAKDLAMVRNRLRRLVSDDTLPGFWARLLGKEGPAMTVTNMTHAMGLQSLQLAREQLHAKLDRDIQAKPGYGALPTLNMKSDALRIATLDSWATLVQHKRWRTPMKFPKKLMPEIAKNAAQILEVRPDEIKELPLYAMLEGLAPKEGLSLETLESWVKALGELSGTALGDSLDRLKKISDSAETRMDVLSAVAAQLKPGQEVTFFADGTIGLNITIAASPAAALLSAIPPHGLWSSTILPMLNKTRKTGAAVTISVPVEAPGFVDISFGSVDGGTFGYGGGIAISGGGVGLLGRGAIETARTGAEDKTTSGVVRVPIDELPALTASLTLGSSTNSGVPAFDGVAHAFHRSANVTVRPQSTRNEDSTPFKVAGTLVFPGYGSPSYGPNEIGETWVGLAGSTAYAPTRSIRTEDNDGHATTITHSKSPTWMHTLMTLLGTIPSWFVEGDPTGDAVSVASMPFLSRVFTVERAPVRGSWHVPDSDSDQNVYADLTVNPVMFEAWLATLPDDEFKKAAAGALQAAQKAGGAAITCRLPLKQKEHEEARAILDALRMEEPIVSAATGNPVIDALTTFIKPNQPTIGGGVNDMLARELAAIMTNELNWDQERAEFSIDGEAVPTQLAGHGLWPNYILFASARQGTRYRGRQVIPPAGDVSAA